MLALGILCLVLGGIYLLLVSPVLDLYNQREATLADRRMLAPRLSAAAAELPELRARLAELQAAATTRKIALDGASDAIAALARQTGDATRDLPASTLSVVRRTFPGLELDREPQDHLAAMGRIFGEDLPSGLVFHE